MKSHSLFRASLQDSAAQVRRDGSTGFWIVHFIRNYVDPNNSNNSYPHDLTPPNMLRPGDRILIDGAVFILAENPSDPKLDTASGFFGPMPQEELYCRLADGYDRTIGIPLSRSKEKTGPTRNNFRFIACRKNRRTIRLQLPAGIVIDLEASGISGHKPSFSTILSRGIPLNKT